MRLALAQQLNQTIFSQFPIVIVSTIVLFAVNFGYYYDRLPRHLLLTSIFALVYSLIFRAAGLAYFRFCEDRHSPDFWWRLAVYLVSLHGFAWSILTISAITSLPVSESLVAMVTLAGVVGTSVGTNSASFPAFSVMAVCALGPYSVIMLSLEQDVYQTVGLMSLLYLVVLILSSRKLAASIRASMHFGLLNERLVSRLEDLSAKDSLTGLKNRRALNEGFAQLWQQQAQSGKPVGLILCDVDYFKQYNDGRGHLAGDDCLRQVAQTLATVTRPSDIIARYGGEEFAALIPNCSEENLARVAERMRRAVRELALPHPRSRVADVVTISVGAAQLLPKAEYSTDNLVELADQALYAAKAQGRDRVILQQAAAL